MLEIGTVAPNFELPDQNGEMHKLSDYRGQKVILYFYPKDNTSGCTKQACGYSERMPQIREKGAVVLGISKDTVASHKRFEEKYGLAFTLLADPERNVIEAYDVWKEKKNYGKSVTDYEVIGDPERSEGYPGEARNSAKQNQGFAKQKSGTVSMGVVRTTYLIDEEGIIIKASDKVKAAEDPEKMLGVL